MQSSLGAGTGTVAGVDSDTRGGGFAAPPPAAPGAGAGAGAVVDMDTGGGRFAAVATATPGGGVGAAADALLGGVPEPANRLLKPWCLKSSYLTNCVCYFGKLAAVDSFPSLGAKALLYIECGLSTVENSALVRLGRNASL